ncbi:MAG: DHA2 family efflux MFS transporter permease subunit [Acidimicrobiia bacterium]
MQQATETTARQRWLTLVVLCLGLLVVSIDAGILNVALPTLVRDIGASPSQLQWIVDAYTLVFAGLLLTSGNLGDRFGRKNVMSLGLLVFAIGSIAATFASSPAQLIVLRAVLGLGGALIMPATLSILVNVFTDAAERRRAIAYWSLMNAAGGFFGPITGGFLLRHFSWHSCFFVNVPFVVAGLVLGKFFVPDSRDPSSARFDFPGAVLSTGALAVLIWATIAGPDRGWGDSLVVGAFTASVALFLAFVSRELRCPAPMLDLRIFREPQLSAAATAMTVSFLAMTGTMFLVSQSLQLVRGYSPLRAALATSGPIVSVNFLVMPRTPRLIGKVGIRWMIVSGSCAVAVAAFVISRTTVHSAYLNLFVGFAVMAFGFSVFVPASTEAIMTAVPPEKAGSASSINQLVRLVGQAMGVAICGSIASSRYRSTFDAEASGLTGSALEAAQHSISGAVSAARELSSSASDAALTAARFAFQNGIRGATLFASVLAVVAAIFGAIAIPGRHALATHLRSEDDDTLPVLD